MKQDSVSGLDAGARRVTVRAIAAETGLSIATISRVLNGGGNVAPGTRERVREVVERLGDRAPEPRRRSRAAAPTRPPVFVRCPYLLTDYFGHIVTSVAETLALHGQSMLLDAGDEAVKSTVVRELSRRHDAYGAVLILPPEPRADLEALAARGYPFVVVDPRTAMARGMVSISAAHFSGARAVTRHLIELGHRRIGVITGPPDWRTRDDRVGGHLAALSEAGVLGDPGLMRYGEPAIKTGVRAGGELLDLRPRPTAVVCFNDKVAVGALEAAATRGLRVPSDLSVAGFDDIDVSRATRPLLTTVRQPLQEMGRTAVTMLMRQLDGHAHEALSMELETRLVVRESTGPAPWSGALRVLPPCRLIERNSRRKARTRKDVPMALEIKRLHLAKLTPPGGDRGEWPVHGFVISHPDGAVLVDTGAGGPEDLINDWRVVNVSVADALSELDMSPADISLVINTHLHFDHCGQNAVFKHAPFYVQRAELDRARRESQALSGWFDFMGAQFELLDGDTEILPGLSVVATPGHTVGHQCVLVQTASGSPDLLIGDAAYTPREYTGSLDQKLPPGQAADRPSWEASIGRVRSMAPSRVHFCHHTDVVHS